MQIEYHKANFTRIESSRNRLNEETNRLQYNLPFPLFDYYYSSRRQQSLGPSSQYDASHH